MKQAPAPHSDHFRVDEASTSTTFWPNVDRLLTSAKPGRPAFSLFRAQRWIDRWETPIVCFLVHCSQPWVQISVNQSTLGRSLCGKAKRTNPLVNPNILIDDSLLLPLQFIFHGMCWNSRFPCMLASWSFKKKNYLLTFHFCVPFACLLF